MNFVKFFNLFGTRVRQIPCLKGSGTPNGETKGAVGCLYMNTDNGYLYKCTAVVDGVCTWARVGAGGSGGGSVDLDTTLTQAGMAADAKAVGDRFGDVETALDAIIDIQNQILGGDGV